MDKWAVQRFFRVCAISAVLTMAACGGGGSSSSDTPFPSPDFALSVDPTTLTVVLGSSYSVCFRLCCQWVLVQR
jgi:hypothetical protein